MKNFIVVVISMLLFASCTPNSNHRSAEHATFMSIPIDGTLNSFIAKMTVKGFTDPISEGDLTTMHGKFLGEECWIYIKSSLTSKLVYSVTVGYPEYDNWADLQDHYFSLKSTYIGKYGEPDDVVETCDVAYNDTLEALKDFAAAYHLSFKRAKGDVTIFMDHFNGSVNVYYADAINLALSEKERETKLHDEI
jgi:hypothetical protein